jgi:hypothetical protein
MSSNNTTYTIDITHMSKSISDDLNLVTQKFINYLPLIFLIFGFIGFIGNVFTYLQAAFRSNTCCIYLLCGSVIDIITLFVNLFPNYLSSVYGISIPWTTSTTLCKIDLFLLVFLPHLSINFLLMSSIDRFASACDLGSPMRRLNQLKMIPWTISITIIYSCLTSIQAPILFVAAPGVWCQATQPTTYSILYIVFNGLLSPLIMVVFILLTHRNVRLSRRRVVSTYEVLIAIESHVLFKGGVNTMNHRHSRNQFIIMIFCQVLATSFFSLQWIIMYMYYLITTDDMRTSDQLAIISFVLSVTNNCFYLNNVKSFYLSMLTSRLFRQTISNGLIGLLPRQIRPRFQVSQANFPMATVARMRRDDVSRRNI